MPRGRRVVAPAEFTMKVAESQKRVESVVDTGTVRTLEGDDERLLTVQGVSRFAFL